ncbi:hypothetical protein [Phaffia rhodozyma]|uniref:Tail specific protease domain-containing protein n=1 Tax=Phaffia rhodozyma TaxID=264483 RepID=A0A0F7SGT5_PHARH|nr:hypothetical protein [Phaffia rhodozyma]
MYRLHLTENAKTMCSSGLRDHNLLTISLIIIANIESCSTTIIYFARIFSIWETVSRTSCVLYPPSSNGGPSLEELDSSLGLQSRQTSTDPCTALAVAKGKLYNVADARACLKSVPFNETIRTNILSVVNKVYDLDLFEYEQISQPLPLNQSTNVRTELDRISKATYSSDYDFNKDLYDMFRTLNDGHHYWSSCYSTAFVTFIPFPLVALSSAYGAKDVKIYVAPDSQYIGSQYNRYFLGLQSSYERLGINVTELAGAEVEMIDGVEPWTFIDKITNNESGSYQDQQIRRNAALASYTLIGSTWTRDLGDIAQQRLPERDNITLQIATATGSKQVVLPYFSRSTSEQAYSSTATFFANNCLAEGSSSGSNSTGLNTETTIIRHPLALFPELDLAESKQVEKRQLTTSACSTAPVPYLPMRLDPSESAQYLGGRNVQFFLLPSAETGGTKVGVIFLATFDPDSGCTQQFITDTDEGFQNFTINGVSKVIIDTTGNGGGSVALNIIWQSLFSGSSYTKYLNFQSVFRYAPLAEKFVNYHIRYPTIDPGYYAPTSFRKDSGSSFISTESFFTEKRSLTANGHTFQTSELIRDTLPSTSYLWTSSNPIYAPEDVIVYGDGTCGSACASFTSFITYYNNYTTVVSTGRPNEPIEFQSFEAGQAASSTAVFSEMRLTGLDGDEDAPPSLLVQGSVGIALRGHVSPSDPNKFMQYISRPADFRFTLTEEGYLNPLKTHIYLANQVWPNSTTSSGSTPGLQAGNTTESSSGSTNEGSPKSKVRQVVRFGWISMTVGVIVSGMDFLF